MPTEEKAAAPEEQDKEVLRGIEMAIARARQNKPDQASERSRRFAVTITELEKAYAYFYTYVFLGMEVG